jgi:hypothetical protein
LAPPQAQHWMALWLAVQAGKQEQLQLAVDFVLEPKQ